MGVWKGALAAAAMLWAGTAQAAIIEYRVDAVGRGAIVQFDYETATATVQYGRAAASFFFYVDSDDEQWSYQYGWADSRLQLAITGNTAAGSVFDRESEYSWSAFSFNGIFQPGIFDDGPFLGVAIARSGTATFESEQFRWGNSEFNGTVQSLTGRIYDHPTTPNAFAQMWITSVPEPTTWAMLLVGFAAVGTAMRGRPWIAWAA